MSDMQPGQIIVPHAADDPKPGGDGAPEPERPVEEPTPVPPPKPEPTPVPGPTTPDQMAAAAAPASPLPQQDPLTETPAAPAPAADEPSFYTGSGPGAATGLTNDLPGRGSASGTSRTDGLSWTTAEFVAHAKSVGWYGALALAGLLAASVDYLLVKDLFSTIVIMLVTVIFGVYAGHKPREQQYELSRQGVRVGARLYSFGDYKNFSLADEGDTASVVFIPLKRFIPPLVIPVAAGLEGQVLDFLGAILPFEESRANAVDGLLRRIRF